MAVAVAVAVAGEGDAEVDAGAGGVAGGVAGGAEAGDENYAGTFVHFYRFRFDSSNASLGLVTHAKAGPPPSPVSPFSTASHLSSRIPTAFSSNRHSIEPPHSHATLPMRVSTSGTAPLLIT